MEYNSRQYALINKGDSLLFKKVVQYLQPQPEDEILEIGCGRGFLTKRMQKFSKSVIGIDVNPESISQGVTSNLKVMDATKLEFPSEFFNKIYSCHVIEHIPDLKKFFQEIEKVLKPNGTVVLVYPWELVRGMGAMGSSLIIFKNPLFCRKIHIHKLNPEKIKKIVKNFNLQHIESHFSLFKSPQYFTILKKTVS